MITMRMSANRLHRLMPEFSLAACKLIDEFLERKEEIWTFADIKHSFKEVDSDELGRYEECDILGECEGMWLVFI